MVYETFLITIQSMVQTRLNKKANVSLRRVLKNNGLMLDGLSFTKPGSRLSPTVYLNAYYNEAEEGMPLSIITDQILMVYETNPGFSEDICEELRDFDAVRGRIAYKLIHAAKNKVLLSHIPHIPYLDLAIVFYLILTDNEEGQMTTLVHSDHLALWDISLEEIGILAEENTPRILPYHISSIESTLNQLEMEDIVETEALPSVALYVLTNSRGINGAACMLYPRVLKEFAESLGEDLIILPSSIHEVLLTPSNVSLPPEELNEMVQAINQSDVPAEDRLSDHIYYFSRIQGCLYLPPSSTTTLYSGADGTVNPQ